LGGGCGGFFSNKDASGCPEAYGISVLQHHLGLNPLAVDIGAVGAAHIFQNVTPTRIVKDETVLFGNESVWNLDEILRDAPDGVLNPERHFPLAIAVADDELRLAQVVFDFEIHLQNTAPCLWAVPLGRSTGRRSVYE